MSLIHLKSVLPNKIKIMLRNILYSPWVLRDILLCYFWGIHRSSGMRLFGVPLIYQSKRGSITIGENFKAVSLARHNSIGVFQRTTIKALGSHVSINIGNNVGISGATISARNKITIGNNVLIGSGVLISDNDAHPIKLSDRNDPSKTKSAPIKIEDDVFIGARAIILKGVVLRRGCVVGAGAVVSKDVAEETIVVGNPARAK